MQVISRKSSDELHLKRIIGRTTCDLPSIYRLNYLKTLTMKHFLLSSALLCCICISHATDYYRINSFPIDGADIRDTFLIVVEYAGNTYIWNGQEATGKNYVCLEKFSSNVISGNYADNEIVVVHNKWHDYYRLFSILCKGDGARESGYYLGGIKGNNGISFNNGQVDAEITYEDTEGIKIATQSGVGIFRFNITPGDPHGFKFYANDINMLYPTLYVKGNNPRYAQEVEYEDLSEQFTYAQADNYVDQTSNNTPKIFNWDLVLYAEEDEEAYPQIYLILTNESDRSIAGSYTSNVADGQAWQVYCTNSSKKSSTHTFISDNGNITSLYFKYCTLNLTPVSKDDRGVYTYLIDLKWVDQNNKHRKVYKQLPIIGTQTIFTADNPQGSTSEIFFHESANDENALQYIDFTQSDIIISGHTIIGSQPLQIYNLVGQNVTMQNGNLTAGIYIVRCGSYAGKIMIR